MILTRAAIVFPVCVACLVSVADNGSAALLMQGDRGGVTETTAPTLMSGMQNPVDPIAVRAKSGDTSPVVTLTPPPARSNDATPSFAGSASDTTTVTVDVYAGQDASGSPVATLKAEGTGGAWASARVSPPLEDGTYTAVATQPSALGDSVGESAPVTFEVDTRAPSVTMSAPPPRSNDTAPTFSGSASEATSVTVEIFEGARAEGNIVATATAQGTRGGWATGAPSRPLPRGEHTFTAIATQPSEVGNPAGRSAPVTFVVDTEPPTITLSARPSPSNDTAPTFSGTTSEATAVTIEVFEGQEPGGRLVASAGAPAAGAGDFTSGKSTPALADGTYTAVASAPSAIGNGTGRSAPVTFSVDTASPSITLNALPSPSADRVPRFSGTASDHTPVTVNVYRAGAPAGTPVATAEAEVAHGEWVTGKTSPALEWGEYTAVASQASSIGNAAGTSEALAFTVAPIAPTVATEAASSVARTSAALYGSADPRGAGVGGCYFEYGPSLAYGTSIECGFVSGSSAFPPAATVAVPVFARIYGLRPSTTYHYRVVVVGEGGTSYGADASFTTLPPYVFPEEGIAHATSAAPHASTRRNAIAANRLRALIANQLRARRRIAAIAALLRRGAFGARFDAPEPGTVAIEWSYSRKRTQRGRAVRSDLVPVARGSLVFRRAGSAALKLRLTHYGRQLLQHAARIHLTETCVFRAPAAPAATVSTTLELQR